MVASSLASNAMHLYHKFTLCTTKWTRDASAWLWRQERRLPSSCSRVVFLSFLIPALFLCFLHFQPYIKINLFHKIFTLYTFCFWGFVNHLPNRRLKHLSLAMRQCLLLTSKYESYCRRTGLLLATNALCAGDEHFWGWRRTRFVLEMNI